MSRFPFILAMLFLSAGYVEAKPDWIDHPPAHTEDKLYFVEGATGAKSAVLARDLALRKAMAAVQAYFGQTIKSELISEEYERDQKYQSMVKLSIRLEGVEVELKGVRIEETWMREPDASRQDWDCWMLVSYPRSEYEATLKKMRDALEARARRALELFREARDLSSRGMYLDALARLEQAKDLLATLRTPVALPDTSIKDTDVLASEVKAAINEANAQKDQARKTVAVKLVFTVASNVSSADFIENARAEVIGVVGRHGLTAAAGEPTELSALEIIRGNEVMAKQVGAELKASYLLIGLINASDTSEIYGQFFAEASGKVALIDAITGRVIGAKELERKKGGYVTKEGARAKAAQELKGPLYEAAGLLLDELEKHTRETR